MQKKCIFCTNFDNLFAYIIFFYYLCSGFATMQVLHLIKSIVIPDYNILRSFGNVPVNTATLKSVLRNINNPNAKIKHWVDTGVLVPLKRGLYIVSPEITMQEPCLELIANHLYSPSYVSLQYAMRHYGLIPERVFLITSITTCHTRNFENALGHFAYHGVSRSYFAVGITSEMQNDRAYLIATPEKALVDTILFSSYIPNSLVGLERFLEEDMRFDMPALKQMNIPLLQACKEVAAKQTIIQNLITLCQR